jgi:hypothetical protein
MSSRCTPAINVALSAGRKFLSQFNPAERSLNGFSHTGNGGSYRTC